MMTELKVCNWFMLRIDTILLFRSGRMLKLLSVTVN